ncbi:hypothetical protein GGR21_000670 [Dysgonomonas hofstadii]|uniref:Uncharacterized protein n=1 Tax=Dysgonomonas hofstadii TaxID=637886 RepID=A0A840CSS2_9BACT|nr:hypothetical protein [Dysgonomonas hofstadii]
MNYGMTVFGIMMGGMGSSFDEEEYTEEEENGF